MMDYESLSLDGDRLTEDDRRAIREWRCFQLTGFGLPGMKWCLRELSAQQVAHGQILCDEHEGEEAEEGGKVVRLAPDDARRVFHRLP